MMQNPNESLHALIQQINSLKAQWNESEFASHPYARRHPNMQGSQWNQIGMWECDSKGVWENAVYEWI